jgi:SprT-like protein
LTDQELQSLVEEISLKFFTKPFLHRARFNRRLRTTGGRYLLKSHDIEINPLHYQEHGDEELYGIIKHELCHYHLHLERKGYKHADQDFKTLLAHVGGTRYCQRVGAGRSTLPIRYKLVCVSCGKTYKRKRKIDPSRYVCGVCRGKLRLESM